MRKRLLVHYMIRGYCEHKGRYLLMFSAISIAMWFAMLAVALSDGVGTKVDRFLSVWGTRKVIIWPAVHGDTATPIPFSDLKALKDEFSSKASISGWCSLSLEISNQDMVIQVPVLAVEPTFKDIVDGKLAEGLSLDKNDEDLLNKNCVLGSAIKKQLFSDESAIGKQLTINGTPFRVKGVNAPLGLSSENSVTNNYVWIPLSTSFQRVIQSDGVWAIHCGIRKGYSIDDIAQNMEAFLIDRHRNSSQDPPYFQVQLPTEMINNIKSATASSRITTNTIAVIALLIAGIFLVSVMITSVSQRRFEIGLKRALGASKANIMVEFFIESSVLSLLGLSIGILFGYCTIYLIKPSFLAKLPMVISFWTICQMFIISVVFGVLIGIVPAFRATRIDPIKALA